MQQIDLVCKVNKRRRDPVHGWSGCDQLELKCTIAADHMTWLSFSPNLFPAGLLQRATMDSARHIGGLKLLLSLTPSQ